MGLPIWRDPNEKKSSNRNGPKPDPTACLRSSIRRRPSVHGRRQNRAHLRREASERSPRFEREPPPSVGFHGWRSRGRGEDAGVPQIPNLLEARAPPMRQTRLSEMGELGDSADSPRDRAAADGLSVDALQRHQRRAILLRQMEMQLPEIGISNNPEASSSQATRRSPTSVPTHTVVFDPAEPMRILRSPEPMYRRRRSNSRESASQQRNTLPTPPLDTSQSGGGDDSLFVSRSGGMAVDRSTIRRARPLTDATSAWPTRPTSSINGLGDRDRSPILGDGWEVMRTTITPDESLPSAESSFASSAASRSFNASSRGTQITEPDSGEGDESSSVAEDLCTEEDAVITEAFAEDIYLNEMRTYEGRQRIAHHQHAREEEGNRFAWARDPPRVEIGFRLIQDALETREGRERLLSVRQNSRRDILQFREMIRPAEPTRATSASGLRIGSRAPSPSAGQYSQEVRGAARETVGRVQDYFRQYEADARAGALTPPRDSPQAPDGPVPDENTLTSNDGPEAHPVSPPSNRSEREVSEALLSGDVQDLDSMRRIVERLARRDDVPEEWWMSMGLNLSRTRPHETRSRSPMSATRRTVVEGRTAAGRVDRSARSNARL